MSPAILLIGTASSMTLDYPDRVASPTLVQHGTEDPLFPPGHGEALAAEIPGPRLVLLEGMGHEVPPHPLWDHVVAALRDHTASTAQ